MTMMKKYILTAFIFLGLTLISCSDFLDKTPSDSRFTNETIVDFRSANIALTGIYNSLQGSSSIGDQGFWYYGSRFVVYGDVMGDFMQSTPNGTRSAVMYKMDYTATSAPSFWKIPYNIIRNSNNLVAAIDAGKITDGSAEDLANVRGQALFIRALAYFDLCRVYGKPFALDNGLAPNGGVPIVTTPIEVETKLGRNTVAEVYTQVIKDLKDAIGDDPKSKLSSDVNPGMANSWAAKALLSRVYLYRGAQQDNIAALALAEDIIHNGPYELWTNVEYISSLGVIGSKEFIMEIVSTPSDNIGNECLGNLLKENIKKTSGLNDYVLTKAFVDIMNQRPNDIRCQLMSAAVEDDNVKVFGNNKVYFNKKYPMQAANTHSIYLLRLSEVYLNAAEAAFKTNDIPKAKKYLNEIYLRADPTATPLQDTDVTLDRILLERGIELVGEGHRFFDLMRNGKEVVRYTSPAAQGWHYALVTESQKFDNAYFRAILPIPVAERDANPVIRDQQNPGYGI